MSHQGKYLLYVLGMTASCFFPLVPMLLFATNGTLSVEVSVTIGVVIAFPFFIYFLVKMYKESKQYSVENDIVTQHQPAHLPHRPVKPNSDTNFVFPSLDQQVRPYFEKLWKTTNEYGWVDVLYNDHIVLQVWNVPNNKTMKNVVLNFSPYSYDNGLVKRFKSCPYYADFAANDSNEDNYMQAEYGTDIEKAMKVASYILTAVYYIPTTAQLQANLNAPMARW